MAPILFWRKMDFCELAKKLNPKLVAVAYKLNGKYTFFNEDDLYQEALLHLWQGHQEGMYIDKTDSYIVQNCIFFLRNHIRKIYKTIDRNSVRLINALQDGEDNGITINELYFCDKAQQDISFINANLCIEDIKKYLSDREREIFSLALEGLTTREIGKRLGVSHVMVIKIEKKIRDKTKIIREEII